MRELSHGRVLLRSFNLFETTDDLVIDEQVLTFRSRSRIEEQLVDAGFVVEAVCGGWDRTPCAGDQQGMVVEARPG